LRVAPPLQMGALLTACSSRAAATTAAPCLAAAVRGRRWAPAPAGGASLAAARSSSWAASGAGAPLAAAVGATPGSKVRAVDWRMVEAG
jgi:hypothetical protein